MTVRCQCGRPLDRGSNRPARAASRDQPPTRLPLAGEPWPTIRSPYPTIARDVSLCLEGIDHPDGGKALDFMRAILLSGGLAARR